MRFLVLSKNGEGVGIAFKLSEEGHDVSLWLEDKMAKRKYDGIVDKVDTIEEGLKLKPDYVVVDSNYFPKESQKIIDEGWATIGGSAEMDKLESDRRYGLEIMEKYGIQIPFTLLPDSIDEAIKMINDPKHKGFGWCIKPDDDAPKDKTFVSRDAKEVLAELESWKHQNFKYNFILQKFEEGVEIDTEIYVSKGNIVTGCKGLFELKKYATGNDGPATGCQSSISWGYKNPNPPIFQKTLKKMAPYFKEHNYTGLFSINCIIREDGEIFAIEFNPRFGYSDTYATMNIIDMEYGDFICGLIDGTLKKIPWKLGYGAAVCLSIPPYPLDTSDPKDDELIKAIYDRFAKDVPVDMDLNSEDYIPLDVYFKDGDLKCAGTGDGICEIMAYSTNLDKLGELLMEKKNNIKVSNKHTRIDMVDDFKERMKKLIDAGYNLTGNNYGNYTK